MANSNGDKFGVGHSLAFICNERRRRTRIPPCQDVDKKMFTVNFNEKLNLMIEIIFHARTCFNQFQFSLPFIFSFETRDNQHWMTP